MAPHRRHFPGPPLKDKNSSATASGQPISNASGYTEGANPDRASTKTKQSKKRRATEEAPEAPRAKKSEKSKKSRLAISEHGSKRPQAREVGSADGNARGPTGSKKLIHIERSYLPPSRDIRTELKTFGSTQLNPCKTKAWSSSDGAGSRSVTSQIAPTTKENHRHLISRTSIATTTKQNANTKAKGKIKGSEKKSVAITVYPESGEPRIEGSLSNLATSNKNSRKREKQKLKRKARRKEAMSGRGFQATDDKSSAMANSASEIPQTRPEIVSVTQSSSRSNFLPDNNAQVSHNDVRVDATDDSLGLKTRAVKKSRNAKYRESDGTTVRKKPISELDLGELRPQATGISLSAESQTASQERKALPSQAASTRRRPLFRPLGGGRITSISQSSDAKDLLGQWKRSMKAAGLFDSDDSENSESSDGESEVNDVEKPPIRGSIQESFAEQIFEQVPPAQKKAQKPLEPFSVGMEEPDADSRGYDPSKFRIVSREPQSSKRYRNISFVDVTDHDSPGRVVRSGSDEPSHHKTAPTARPIHAARPTSTDSMNQNLTVGMTNSSSASALDASANTPKLEVPDMDEFLQCRQREVWPSGNTADETRETLELMANPDLEEIDFDVYAAVDEATNEMLGEHIEAMDKCKHPSPKQSSAQSHGDAIVTIANSDHAAEALDSSSAGKTTRSSLENEEQGDGEAGEGMGFVERDLVPVDDLTNASKTDYLRDGPAAHTSNPSSDPPAIADPYRKSQSPAVVLVSRHEIQDAFKSSSRITLPKRKMTGASSKHFADSITTRRARNEQKNGSHEKVERSAITEHQNDWQPGVSEMPSKALAIQSTRDDPTSDKRGQVDMIKQTDHKEQNLRRHGLRSMRQAVSGPKANVSHSTDFVPSTPQQESSTAAVKTPKTAPARKTPASQRRHTGAISSHFIDSRVDLYNTTTSSRKVPAGTSVVPAPSINCDKFGIIQEVYWDQPFWLLVAVALLNRTTGRAAVPVFKKIKAKYKSAEELAVAEHDDVREMIGHLGLQNNRTKTLTTMAQQWAESPPRAARLYRQRDYPESGDGKASDVANIVEDDVPICKGAIEIGHLYGCGAYAFDSWRIFCRDVLRGVANDYKGLDATIEDFEPEWKRVVPKDKELRACLRWMWLSEGWVWNPLDGSKRRASEEEMRRAVKGEMEIADVQERQFAARAAGIGLSPGKAQDYVSGSSQIDTPSKKGKDTEPNRTDLTNTEKRRKQKTATSGRDLASNDSFSDSSADDEVEEERETPSNQLVDTTLNDDRLAVEIPKPARRSTKTSSETSSSSSTRRRTPSRFAKVVPSIEAEEPEEPEEPSTTRRKTRSSAARERAVAATSGSRSESRTSTKRGRDGRFVKGGSRSKTPVGGKRQSEESADDALAKKRKRGKDGRLAKVSGS